MKAILMAMLEILTFLSFYHCAYAHFLLLF